MKILLTVSLWCLLFPIGLAQAGPLFPAVIPFDSIYYVTPPSANGDQLVVGRFPSLSAYSSFLSLVPLPGAPNELFADASIQLAPGVYFTGVYVPTAAERMGDFSSFAGVLIDPLTHVPFSSNLIPPTRRSDPYAFRIHAVPEPGTVVVTFLGLLGLLVRKLRS